MNQQPNIFIIEARRSAWVEINGKARTTSKRFLACLAVRDCRRWVKKHYPNSSPTHFRLAP